jgi:hypothetical protein
MHLLHPYNMSLWIGNRGIGSIQKVDWWYILQLDLVDLFNWGNSPSQLNHLFPLDLFFTDTRECEMRARLRNISSVRLI